MQAHIFFDSQEILYSYPTSKLIYKKKNSQLNRGEKFIIKQGANKESFWDLNKQQKTDIENYKPEKNPVQYQYLFNSSSLFSVISANDPVIVISNISKINQKFYFRMSNINSSTLQKLTSDINILFNRNF